MAKVSIETDLVNFKEKSSSTLNLWRCVRLIDTEVDKATIADYAYCKESILGEDVRINKNAFILNSKIGDKSQVGFNTKVLYAEIGKFCSISWDCSIGGPNHNMKACTTFNFTGDRSHYLNSICKIGNDVWIGAGVIVMRGITIGCGAIVGGGSVVTHNVENYEIVAGVPARHLGWRFDEDIRNKLSNSKWWDMPLDTIIENQELLSSDINEEVLNKILKLTNQYYGKVDR